MVVKKIGTLVILMLTVLNPANAQSVVSEIELTDLQRIQQLTDTATNRARSFMIRSSSRFQEKLNNPGKTWKELPKIYPVHIGYTAQHNNHMAFSENDGSMIPNIGLQQRATAGVLINWYLLSIQIQPEWIKADNTAPIPFKPDPADPNFLARYYVYVVNKSDHLERFGTNKEERFLKGQSRISLNLPFNISVDASTENLWWGPGRRNSLVLTNTAPGFLHYSLQSRKPINTPFGNIEFQVMNGVLDKTRYESHDNELMRNVWAGGILQKPNTRRGIWGYVLSWNPKWLKGLFLGTAGVEYFYRDSVAVTENPLLISNENKKSGAKLGSFFVRYAMPADHAEVWLEYGRGNKFVNPFNIWSDTIPTAYILGARKLFPLGAKKKSYFELSAELTQLQLPDTRLIHNGQGIFGLPRTNSWYTHPYVTQGYTSDGQALGAYIGPGSNSLRLDMGWVKGNKRISIFGERVAKNYDFYYYNYFTGNIGYGYADRNWTDLTYGGQIRWDIGPIILAGSWQQTRTLNYKWTKLEGGFSEPSPSSDRWNTRVQFSLFYQRKWK